MQRPSALGLFLCNQVIVDRETGNRTLVEMFDSVEYDQFPTAPIKADIFAVLTDGHGRVSLDLVVSHINTGDQLAIRREELDCPDPLVLVYVRYRLRGLSFPAAGQYLFELFAGGESICHRRLHVLSSEE